MGYSPKGLQSQTHLGTQAYASVSREGVGYRGMGRTGKHQGNLVEVIAGSSSFTWRYKGEDWSSQNLGVWRKVVRPDTESQKEYFMRCLLALGPEEYACGKEQAFHL